MRIREWDHSQPASLGSPVGYATGNRGPCFVVCSQSTAMRKSSKQITPKRFKLHDHVSWNSEAGRVSGRIIKVHTKNVNYKGYVHHASKDAPQYEIESDKTDHVALHKGSALRLVRRKS
jgi:Hypervirulence associated proteins TUDOR domain